MGYEMNTGTQMPTYGSNISGHSEDGCRTFEQNTGTHLLDSIRSWLTRPRCKFSFLYRWTPIFLNLKLHQQPSSSSIYIFTLMNALHIHFTFHTCFTFQQLSNDFFFFSQPYVTGRQQFLYVHLPMSCQKPHHRCLWTSHTHKKWRYTFRSAQ